jgi:ABC-type glycerol-3-phosphate transport system permease component
MPLLYHGFYSALYLLSLFSSGDLVTDTSMTNSLKSKKMSTKTPKILMPHILCVGLSLLFCLPFLWMVLTSLKSLENVASIDWWPEIFHWENYKSVFTIENLNYGRWYLNSLFIAFTVTFVQVFTSSLAAFAFSRLKWKWRDRIFLLYLSTMMVPGLILMIPNFQMMIRLGLVDSYLGMILPASFSAFGTFLLRQFMMGIPTALDEAATIDGASTWQVFWNVILPLSRPGLITLCIFTFMGNYNSFFWPLVMLKSDHQFTLPIGLLFFESSQGQQTNLLMAAITMAVVPMIVVFVTLQKHLVKGIQMGGVKG